MTGAMYAAIAGLRTHMQNMNVIGHNIANVNTYGYKASRSVFKTALYTSLNGGSNGTDTMGGINPSQIGYGANVANVDIDMSTGNYAVTGMATDMMLAGDGFFLVGTKDLAANFDGSSDDINRLTSLTLTRVGDFQFRADGYLAKNDGNVLYGFLCTGLVTEAMLTGDDKDKYIGMNVGDPIFSDQLVPIRYPRVQAAHYYQIDPDTGEYVTETKEVDGKDVEVPVEFDIDKDWDKIFDENGKLLNTVSAEGLKIAYPKEGENGHLVDAGYDPALKDSILTMGRFNSISIDPNTGMITATSDDTKETVVIGCVAIGTVTNPNGVTSMGDNYYKAGPGSGQLTIAVGGGNAAAWGISQVNRSLWRPDEDNPNDSGVYDGLTIYASGTKIISNGLEMSKTDLAQEISQMILTQRGYQANTRIITVTDSMLEELVNMKRG